MPSERARRRSRRAVGWCMAKDASPPSGQAKKPGRGLKEKRAAKHAKQEAKATARKAWEK